jgi:hypothetical protein
MTARHQQNNGLQRLDASGSSSGIQTLLTLCERWHTITLYEMGDYLGGNVVADSVLPRATPPQAAG